MKWDVQKHEPKCPCSWLWCDNPQQKTTSKLKRSLVSPILWSSDFFSVWFDVVKMGQSVLINSLALFVIWWEGLSVGRLINVSTQLQTLLDTGDEASLNLNKCLVAQVWIYCMYTFVPAIYIILYSDELSTHSSLVESISGWS